MRSCRAKTCTAEEFLSCNRRASSHQAFQQHLPTALSVEPRCARLRKRALAPPSRTRDEKEFALSVRGLSQRPRVGKFHTVTFHCTSVSLPYIFMPQRDHLAWRACDPVENGEYCRVGGGTVLYTHPGHTLPVRSHASCIQLSAPSHTNPLSYFSSPFQWAQASPKFLVSRVHS